MIKPRFLGAGLASEASAAFVAHAYTAATELLADVDPRNSASLRVLGKLGFIATGRASGTFLFADEWCDSVDLALPCSGC